MVHFVGLYCILNYKAQCKKCKKSKWIVQIWDWVEAWTGFMWLRKGTRGRLL